MNKNTSRGEMTKLFVIEKKYKHYPSRFFICKKPNFIMRLLGSKYIKITEEKSLKCAKKLIKEFNIEKHKQYEFIKH